MFRKNNTPWNPKNKRYNIIINEIKNRKKL